MARAKTEIESILSKYFKAPVQMTLPPLGYVSEPGTFVHNVAPNQPNPSLQKQCGCFADPPGICYECPCGGHVGDLLGIARDFSPAGVVRRTSGATTDQLLAALARFGECNSLRSESFKPGGCGIVTRESF